MLGRNRTVPGTFWGLLCLWSCCAQLTPAEIALLISEVPVISVLRMQFWEASFWQPCQLTQLSFCPCITSVICTGKLLVGLLGALVHGIELVLNWTFSFACLISGCTNIAEGRSAVLVVFLKRIVVSTFTLLELLWRYNKKLWQKVCSSLHKNLLENWCFHDIRDSRGMCDHYVSSLKYCGIPCKYLRKYVGVFWHLPS